MPLPIRFASQPATWPQQHSMESTFSCFLRTDDVRKRGSINNDDQRYDFVKRKFSSKSIGKRGLLTCLFCVIYNQVAIGTLRLRQLVPTYARFVAPCSSSKRPR